MPFSVSSVEHLPCAVCFQEQEAQKYMRAWYSNKIEVEKWKQVRQRAC